MHSWPRIVVQLNSPLPNNSPVANRASLHSLEGSLLHTSVVTHTMMNYLPMVFLAVTDALWTSGVPVIPFVNLAQDSSPTLPTA